jgi:hypothetical protein
MTSGTGSGPPPGTPIGVPADGGAGPTTGETTGGMAGGAAGPATDRPATDRPATDRPATALDRVLPAVGGIDTVERLAALSGSDFTTVMLEVTRRRAARETAASVRRRYSGDRFTTPGHTPWRTLRRAEEALLACLPADVEMLTLAPVVPLGTHSALATVSQDKVLTTIRACEVAADPTNALALEAAVRRVHDRAATVRLGALQRVVRTQLPPPGFAAHFGLFGLVTAGRDEGDHRFERAALAEHLRFAVASLAAARLRYVQLALTPLSEAGERIAAAVTNDLGGDRSPGTAAVIVVDHTRASGRGYYQDLCFKVNARTDGRHPDSLQEVGDGGFTSWTQQLVASQKERLLISGIGVDRLAACGPP